MSNPFEISRICVCGAGTMGSGIAQVMATAGFPILLFDLNPAALERARGSIRHQLEQQVLKKRITPEQETEIWRRLAFTSDPSACKGDLCLEAIVEEVSAKLQLFSSLAAINGRNCLYASNTSSLSLTGISASFPFPDRLVGLHFFNPAPMMKLVEVVLTPATDQGFVGSLTDFVKKLGKHPVVCHDSPGFIVNRVARPFYIEALRLVEEGAVEVADMDEIMESTGFRMGPFRLMDLIGNDINYSVSCTVFDQLGHPERLRPSEIQRKMVQEGHLGRKSGRGYYNYTGS